ncbi:aminotransferase class IV [Sunxiuqinia sp. A32]|uniref:aminotransferase class IV n=1 Tax=Sunxiuqinia sp. A32 TaxID=3461496 RepID=UPI0040467E5A
MANSIFEKYLVLNSNLVNAEGVVFPLESAVYEVLRVIGGVPLFWEDHYQRLIHSVELSGFSIKLSQSEFADQLKRLILINEIAEGNIKIDLYRTERSVDIYTYFIPHKYPDLTTYKIGVETSVLHAERANPKAKVHQHGLRETANKLIQTRGIFEVLLVNSNNQVTEGSRTNVFFYKDDQFYTASSDQVLSGITRQKVIQCLKNMGEKLFERNIHLSEISEMNAIFLTGTSPKVLPVRKIDDMIFSVKHKKVLKLMQTFDQFIESYISSNNAKFCS